MGQIDTLAAQLFDEQTWSDVLEAADVDWEDVISVISSYAQSVDTMHNLPVAQAMINLKTHRYIALKLVDWTKIVAVVLCITMAVVTRLATSGGHGLWSETIFAHKLGSVEADH